MKQLEVQIMGQSYLLACPDGGEARLLDAVERVDTAMCKIREGGKVRARDRIAVLAAINLAFDLAHNSTTSPTPTATSASGLTGKLVPDPQQVGSDPLLSSLLERLDAALGEDGRLI